MCEKKETLSNNMNTLHIHRFPRTWLNSNAFHGTTKNLKISSLNLTPPPLLKIKWKEEPGIHLQWANTRISGLSRRLKDPPRGAASNAQDYCYEDGIPIEHVKIIAKFKSPHNYIRVLEVSRRAGNHPLAGSRLLLLDASGNIHSISFLLNTLTETYFDVFATFPPILPPGPIGILGFGAGTAARLILSLYTDAPEVHGWEIDPSVIAVGRDFFELRELERQHPENLFIHFGDALEAEMEGGFAGILVDLFAKGSVIPELQEAKTWERLRARLRPGGRIMVNCGGSCVEAEDTAREGDAVKDATLRAMVDGVADEVFVLSLGHSMKGKGREEDSWVALTGPPPGGETWKRALPDAALRCYVDMWRPVDCKG